MRTKLTKIIDGKKYYIAGVFNKSAALKHAKEVRKEGLSARIIKYKEWYELWTRPKLTFDLNLF
ncbi:hypothetical protein KAW18_01930 [candidate division WOR-3 bacterium]|nr:hypothetical protein [candidate division WOR-3 bacterium]